MKTSRHSLVDVISERTLHITDSKKLASEIAAYLLEENLTSDLDSIMRDVMKYRLEHGIVEVDVISAHKLSDQDITDIKDLLVSEFPEATSYSIDERIDPYVIGGVKLEFPGSQLDLSVFSKLNLFKRHMTSGKE